jgi:hypothetical protein
MSDSQKAVEAKLREGTEVLRLGGGANLSASECSLLLDVLEAHERYQPIIAALGIYGEQANLEALVEKVRSFPEIKRHEDGDPDHSNG